MQQAGLSIKGAPTCANGGPACSYYGTKRIRSPPAVALYEDVLRLEVRVDEAQRVQEGERAQRLARDALDARVGEVGVVAALLVVLLELVQVGAQQLAHQEQVLLHTRGSQRGVYVCNGGPFYYVRSGDVVVV